MDAAVICEPEENQLCVKQKGALRVEVTVRGKMAHGAMPLSGVNPVTRAARFVVAVEELEREEIERHGEDPFLGYPSLTPTILMGPDCGEPQINVIPASAYVALDIRTVPAQSHEELVRRLEDVSREARIGRPRLRRHAGSDRGAPADRDPERRPAGAGDGEGLRASDRRGAALQRGAGRDRRHFPERVGRHPHRHHGGRGP